MDLLSAAPVGPQGRRQEAARGSGCTRSLSCKEKFGGKPGTEGGGDPSPYGVGAEAGGADGLAWGGQGKKRTCIGPLLWRTSREHPDLRNEWRTTATK